MATFIPFIPYVKDDGTARVRIKVTQHRQRRYLSTEIYVTKQDLTKKNKVKAPEILRQIQLLINDLQTRVAEIGLRSDSMSVDEIVSYLKKTNTSTIDFISFARNYINKIRAQRPGTARNYTTALNNLCSYIKRDTLDIKMITTPFLTDYCNSIAGTRAKSLYLCDIQTIFNAARDYYELSMLPFARVKIPRQQDPEKKALSLTKIRQIINYVPTGLRDELARDCWLLSFSLAGMNAVDLYGCEHIKQGIITYNRSKTKDRRKDKAVMQIRIELPALVEKYKDKKRVFNFFRHYASVGNFNQALNKGLKKILPGLTFYSARHTWATIAINECGIDKYTVHEALNHSDAAMRITDVYIRRDFSRIWNANKKVLEHIGYLE